MSTGSRAGHGFTLIELLVVVTIVAVLGMVAAPAIQRTVARASLRGLAGDFAAALLQARSEAIRAARRTYIIPATGTSWTTGWLIYEDTNGNGSYDSATDRVVARTSGITTGITTDTVGLTSVAYEPTGYPMNLANGCVGFKLSSNPWGEKARQVIVAPTGRVRVVEVTPGAACPNAAGS